MSQATRDSTVKHSDSTSLCDHIRSTIRFRPDAAKIEISQYVRVFDFDSDLHGPMKLPTQPATLHIVRNAIRGWMKELGGAWRTGI
jgi:hypothetical protein